MLFRECEEIVVVLLILMVIDDLGIIEFFGVIVWLEGVDNVWVVEREIVFRS